MGSLTATLPTYFRQGHQLNIRQNSLASDLSYILLFFLHVSSISSIFDKHNVYGKFSTF